MSDSDSWCALLIGLLLGGLVGLAVGKFDGARGIQIEAVERGAAYYDPKTAEFQWREPSEPKTPDHTRR